MFQFGTGIFVGGIIALTYPRSWKYYHDITKYDSGILLHMFSHQNEEHWLNNMINFAYSALFLDFGFVMSLYLYISSGIAGLIGVYVKEHYSQSQLFFLKPRYVIGSSGAVFGFRGCEIMRSFKEAYRISKGKYQKKDKMIVQFRVASLINNGIIRIVHTIYQFSLDRSEFYAHLGGL